MEVIGFVILFCLEVDSTLTLDFFINNTCIFKISLYLCSVKSRQSLSNQTAGYCFFPL